jgi:hypothetical protein
MSELSGRIPSFENDDIVVEDKESHNRRRAGPPTPEHKFCDVYVDITKSFYLAQSRGATTVRTYLM